MPMSPITADMQQDSQVGVRTTADLSSLMAELARALRRANSSAAVPSTWGSASRGFAARTGAPPSRPGR